MGLCGAQGIGKSTLTAVLRRMLVERGHKVASVSLDDFYLTREERTTLARTVHPLLQTRGVPGTHDLALAMRLLSDLRMPGYARLPSFDKATDDRRSQEFWDCVATPVDILLLEGWCVGASPQHAGELEEPVNALEREEDPSGIWRQYVNGALATTYRSLFEQIDLLILLAAPSFDHVYHWRLEQEHALKKAVAGRGGDSSRVMSDRELEHFISYYERLTCHILTEMPTRADVTVTVDRHRRMLID